MEITENGKPLARKYYTFDEKNKVLTVDKDRIVTIDASDAEGWTINCGGGCTIEAKEVEIKLDGKVYKAVIQNI